MIDKYNQYLAVQWDDMFGTSPIIYKNGYSVIAMEKRGTEKITCTPPKKTVLKIQYLYIILKQQLLA